MIPDAVLTVADAVLYEGYMLYPYRASSLKNTQRWTFGGLNPRECCPSADLTSGWLQQAEFLVRGDSSTVIQPTIRFLHHGLPALDEIRNSSPPAAVERTMTCDEVILSEVVGISRVQSFSFPPVDLPKHDSVDSQNADCEFASISGTYEITAELLDACVFRFRLRISNCSRTAGGQVASFGPLPQTMSAVHAICTVIDGEFVSMTDPPDSLSGAARNCVNIGVWPILVGQPGDCGTLLCSPIILNDYPQIAPASPGNLYDGTEIDEILTLRVRTLTDVEKEEARLADERVELLLRRSEALSPEQLLNLHAQMHPSNYSAGSGL